LDPNPRGAVDEEAVKKRRRKAKSAPGKAMVA